MTEAGDGGRYIPVNNMTFFLFRCFAIRVNVHVDSVNKMSGKIQSKQRQIDNSTIFSRFLLKHYFVRSLLTLRYHGKMVTEIS